LTDALNAGEVRLLSSKKAQDLIFHAAGTDINQDLYHKPLSCQIDSIETRQRSKFCVEQSSPTRNEDPDLTAHGLALSTFNHSKSSNLHDDKEPLFYSELEMASKMQAFRKIEVKNNKIYAI